MRRPSFFLYLCKRNQILIRELETEQGANVC